jgi:hypothetical protein
LPITLFFHRFTADAENQPSGGANLSEQSPEEDTEEDEADSEHDGNTDDDEISEGTYVHNVFLL